MKYIKTDYDIPYYNMALEEYLMESEKYDDEYLFFYIHKPSVIIGKFQNAMSEVDMKYLNENNIILSRRISGGGAVYHDEGNLNFSFVCKNKGREVDFAPFVEPMIEALENMGIFAELSGRNDLMLEGRKLGGNAQHIKGGKVLSHGTILVNTDIEEMTKALSVDTEKYKSRGIKSVRSRVVNLNEYAMQMTAQKLRDYLVEQFSPEEIVLDEEDIAAVEEKVKNKFSTWEHNFGTSPDFSVRKKKKLPGGLIEAALNVKGGIIDDIAFTGDFFANCDVEVLTDNLCGVKLEYGEVKNAICGLNVIAGVSDEELVQLIVY